MLLTGSDIICKPLIADNTSSRSMENIAASRDALLQLYILQKDTAAVSAVSGSYDQLFPSPADKCLKCRNQPDRWLIKLMAEFTSCQVSK